MYIGPEQEPEIGEAVKADLVVPIHVNWIRHEDIGRVMAPSHVEIQSNMMSEVKPVRAICLCNITPIFLGVRLETALVRKNGKMQAMHQP